MLKVFLLLVIASGISGCGGWKYKANGEVAFEIRSWNHDPIIRVVEKADTKSFMDLGEGFGKDKYRVFYKGDEITGASPETFEKIHWAYSKDSNAVYLFTCKLEKAGPETFQLLDGSWSKDSKSVYHGHQLVEADASTFRYVGNNQALDSANAYHALSSVSLGCDDNSHLKVKIFRNIDLETFKVIDGFKAQDKNGAFDALPSPNKALQPTAKSGG